MLGQRRWKGWLCDGGSWGWGGLVCLGMWVGMERCERGGDGMERLCGALDGSGW
jgi:hypothetical protein